MVTTQEPGAFAAELTTGLRDVGQVRFEGEGDDSIVFIKPSDSAEAPGEYRFAETLREISEAIGTAPRGATILRLVTGGVVAV